MIDLAIENPELMLNLYANGAFPMASSEDGIIRWYYPEVRAIIPLDNYHIPRSLKNVIKKNLFDIKYDTNRETVIRNCANRKETWINEELIAAYKRLIEREYLHSVEVFQKNRLVGGLYGISINGCFFGESMFSKVTNASKVALYFLIQRLCEKGFSVLDVQYITEHLKMFGAVEISLENFKALVQKGLDTETDF